MKTLFIPFLLSLAFLSPSSAQNYFDENGRWVLTWQEDFIIFDADRWHIESQIKSVHGEKLYISKIDTICYYDANGQYLCEIHPRTLELDFTTTSSGFNVVHNQQKLTLFNEDHRPNYRPCQEFPPIDSQSHLATVKGIILPQVVDSFESVEEYKIIVRNYLTSQSEVYFINPDKTGSFTVKLPLPNPQTALLQLQNKHTIFVEPGQIQFVLINSVHPVDWLFMGSMADLNHDYQSYQAYGTMSRLADHIKNESNGLEPHEFQRARAHVLDSMRSFAQEFQQNNHVSPAFGTWIEIDMEMSFYDDLMRYTWLRKYENKPVLVEHPDYFSFIPNVDISTPEWSMSWQYSSYLHELVMYTHRQFYHVSNHPPLSFWQELLTKPLTDSEKQIIGDRIAFENNLPSEVKVYRDLWHRHGRVVYQKVMAAQGKTDSVYFWLVEAAPELSSSQQAQLKYGLDQWTVKMKEGSVITKKYVEEYRRALEEQRFTFIEKNSVHAAFIKMIYLGELFAQSLRELHEKNAKHYLDKLLRLNPHRHQRGFYQELYQDMLEKMQQPLPAFSLLSEPKAGSAEEFLHQLTQKHAGKMIYVDIWATWCGPCVGEFSYAAETKKKLAELPVAFVYLCASGDKDAWNNLIAKHQLDGDHYFLDEALSGKISRLFSVNAYPSYLLLDKTGRVVNFKAPRPSGRSVLFDEINRYLK